MRKLNVPAYEAIASFDTCVGAIGNELLRSLFEANRDSIMAANTNFDAAQAGPNWIVLPRAQHGNPQALIAGALTKGHLVDLYESYMVGAKGASRDIYDKILTSAGGLCPFCAGLGQVRTLDHYLPKAYYPAYSVHPSNLVPCCGDCNSGKLGSFGTQAYQQTIHPYLDSNLFFVERWIEASVELSEPILIKFHCTPPHNWNDLDKRRAKSHFDSYKLARRYSVQASGEVSKVVQLRANSLWRLTPESFREYLHDNASSADFDLNGWSRTMYAALAMSDWFVHADFQNPGWLTAAAA